MEEKRLYSLNTVAELYRKGFEEIKIGRDEEKDNCFYFVFPYSVEISTAINNYRNNKELQDFLKAYKKVRAKINEINTID